MGEPSHASPANNAPAARFPLPGLLLALLLVGVVHGPLLTVGPLLDEGPFLAGLAESRGAALSMRWLPIEAAWFHGDAFGHRLFALLLEGVTLLLAALALRRTARPSLALLLIAAYLVHPWRCESFVRLGSRAVLLAEFGVALAAWLATLRGPIAAVVSAVAAALATSGAPLFALALLPAALLLRGSAARRCVPLAIGAAAGVALWWPAAPPALASATSGAALELLAAPWRTGFEQPSRPFTLFALAGALLLVAPLLVASRARHRATALLVGVALLAGWAAPGLRPPRTGLEYLGSGMTPEGWLPALALLLVAALVACGPLCSARWRQLPLLAHAALAVGGGFVQARRFEAPLELLDHAIAVAPESVELKLLRGQLHLAASRLVEPEQGLAFADEALALVERAKRLRPGDPAVLTLEVLALALRARLDDAREVSDRLLEAFPDDWRSRVARAELEAIAGDRVAALRWMRSAVAASDLPALRVQLARLLDEIYRELRVALADRRWEEARSLCERLVAIAPEEMAAREAYIDTFTLAGQLTQALAAAEELFAAAPRSANVVQRLASLHERLGHGDEARRFQLLLRELRPPGGTP